MLPAGVGGTTLPTPPKKPRRGSMPRKGAVHLCVYPETCLLAQPDRGALLQDARSLLRHIRVASKHELKARILAYLDGLNREHVIHTWTYKIDESFHGNDGLGQISTHFLVGLNGSRRNRLDLELDRRLVRTPHSIQGDDAQLVLTVVH